MNDLIIIDEETEPTLPDVVSVEEVTGCNLLAAQVQSHLAAAWHKAVILGYKLSIIKARCKHGEWQKLFGKANLNHGFNFSQQMALRYMQLYTACAARAKELKENERLSALLGYTTGEMDGTVDVAAKVEELGGMLSELTGGATSMRQALFAFMHEDDPPPAETAQDYFKGERNTKGRLRKGRELSEAELLEARKAQNWEALNRALNELQASLAAGLHLLLPQGCRGKAISAVQDILDKLTRTNEN